MLKVFATPAESGSRRATFYGVSPGGAFSDMFHQNGWNYVPGGISKHEPCVSPFSHIVASRLGATSGWPPQKLEKFTAKACPQERYAV